MVVTPTIFFVQSAASNNDNDQETQEQQQLLMSDETSHRMRKLASMNKRMIHPPQQPRMKRKIFPETQPHVCLAFLSCCGRIDLLNHTIAGAIRHIEEDEPPFLRYEIAWVDNGSSNYYDNNDSHGDGTTATTTKGIEEITDNYEIEHALILNQNMGLAYGMNLLIFDLCTAPYILLLEEDWLYLDELVAIQTPQRQRSIATSIALVETMEKQNLTAYDGRMVMGTFLRHETYESFLTFPHAGK